MADLAAAYARVPEMHCKGLCADACGPVGCSSLEADAMAAAGVIPPRVAAHPTHGPGMCSHLTPEGRCAIYAHRPMVCRLWGAVRRLRCQHGCKPAGGYLSDEQAAELFSAVSDGRPDYFADPDLRDALRVEAVERAKRQARTGRLPG